MSLYNARGVSAQKEEVHKATASLDKGLYPHAFCKIYADYLGGDAAWVNVMHADGAGTKSIVAYLYWKETHDASVWKGIAQDAIVMNLDDLLCTGIYDNLLFSSTIDRNKQKIPGEVLEMIVTGTQEFFDSMKLFGINIHYLGGETADVGDVVRTIAVNGTMTARWPKDKLITNDRIQPGDVIVGLASAGQAEYERTYNSGIASNGLTSARHDLLSKFYAEQFPESFAPSISAEVMYAGPYHLMDEVSLYTGPRNQVPGVVSRDLHPERLTIGQLLLSPTRTYAPVMKALFDHHFDAVHGLVHCSGGGQTKCLKYLPGEYRIIKDNLFDPPPIFRLIQQASGADDREMYQVFNMGHRIEIFTSEEAVPGIINLALGLGIDARIIGRVEAAEKKELILHAPHGRVVYP
ncbi:MAG TPA: AIR synthase related protein [Chitinophagaceae bacterium]|nr:AIR synthase related protein [Chitinophagaceae bacterium]